MNRADALSASAARAKEELEALLHLMGYEAKVEAFPQGEDEILLHIESPDAARLIGRGAQVLDALQYVLNRALYKQNTESLHCVVDIERYRERRKDKILKDTLDAAERVRQTSRPVRLAPMRAGERRIVHQALKDEPDLETFSEETDEEGVKRVIVRLREGSAHAAEPEEPGNSIESVPEELPLPEDDSIGNR